MKQNLSPNILLNRKELKAEKFSKQNLVVKERKINPDFTIIERSNNFSRNNVLNKRFLIKQNFIDAGHDNDNQSNIGED